MIRSSKPYYTYLTPGSVADLYLEKERKMLRMVGACKATQENFDACRDLKEGWNMDSTNELSDDKAAGDTAVAAPADGEQEDDSPSRSPPAFTDAEWAEHLREQQEDHRCGEYAISSNDTMVFETVDIDVVPPPKVVEYVSKPFAELHNLYNYLRTSNEDSCREYAQKRFGDKLTDVGWLKLNLDKGENAKHRFEMADKQWNAPGQIELTDWADFFEKVGLPRVKNELREKLFLANKKLRHTAVHRRHWELSRESLETAMVLPALLGDNQRASDIEQVYEALLQDPSTLDARTRSFVNERLYTQNEPVFIPELLDQIQSLLEASAFNYAIEADPTFLEKYGFEVPEQVELQEYWRRWDESSSQVRQHPDSLSLYPDPEGRRSSFRSTLKDVKDLRNYGVHRLFNVDPDISTADDIRKPVEWAKTFAIMVGHPATADKIELIASTWFAKYRPTAGGA